MRRGKSPPPGMKCLALVGFSGTGKSTWAKRLSSKCSFKQICCDDSIEKKLKGKIRDKRFNGIHSVAAWMGHPDETGFKKREALYLACEREVMEETLDQLTARSNLKHRPTVIDTTGSVIYMSSGILKRLRKMSTVVYFQLDEQLENAMFQQYLREPKPVIWSRFYRRKKGESKRNALSSSFRRLMEDRRKKYEKLAHVILKPKIFRGRIRDGKMFLREIAEALL